jgi:U3 small nucleolar RNA-associated protein 21
MVIVANDQEASHPPRKKVRSESTRNVTASHPSVEPSNSPRLFAPFRALGLITNQVPFALRFRAVKGSAEGPRMHILTCLGNSWSLWEGEKITLLFVGE